MSVTPHRCNGCHNPDQWSFEGGQEFTSETLEEIKQAISANNVQRNFSILGGEPLCEENLFLTTLVVKEVREAYPNIKIYLWTGYNYEVLLQQVEEQPHLKYILNNVDILIDGPYIKELRDITLPLRGSANQRIIDLTKNRKYDII